MEDFFIILLQFLFEFLLDVLAYFPFDLLDLSFHHVRKRAPESKYLIALCCLWLIAGLALAGLSILCFKHTLITLPSLRIANLLLAPLTSALISQKIARRRAQDNPYIIPRNHFWQAFWFTLGVVSIRFAYAQRF